MSEYVIQRNFRSKKINLINFAALSLETNENPIA